MKYQFYLVIAITLIFNANVEAVEINSSTTQNTGNPSISVIGNFTGERIRGDAGAGSSAFLPLSETEFVFGANIDPHARLDVTVTGADGGMAVEEGFITSYLPYDINLKSGRKFLPVGRVNGVHPHALIYADRPNGLVNVLGAETFVGDGLFVERPYFIGDSAHTLTAGLFSNTNDVAFNPNGEPHYAGLLRWTGVWDSSENATLELGANIVSGKNGIAASHANSTISGAHMAWKFQNLQSFAVNIEAEAMRSQQQQGVGVSNITTDGAYLLADIGFDRHWHVFSRLDYSALQGVVGASKATETALSVGVVWKISEFQNLTLQYKQMRHALDQVADVYGINAGDNANALLFRWVVAIGPHGAHAY
ncbi:MAG: hypothetical protein AUK35_05525 [Zetaproteobacteria bacterium CG2_30_46_52]|nr:MAG: hypothetical protein AUK35_05525 [Zetaproteobacteria bacterium CG2_30_46_52]